MALGRARERPDMPALVAAAQLVAIALGAPPPPDAELVALFERILLREQPAGKDGWACFRHGILTDVETRDLVLAHLETWFEHRVGRQHALVDVLHPDLIDRFDHALFGQPATEIVEYSKV